MTNDHIQKWLAAYAAAPSLLQIPDCHAAYQIIRWLSGPDGAIGIADDAAWELIRSECECVEDVGYLWYETHLHIDDEDVERALWRAVRYLIGRGMLVAHRRITSLVRHIDSGATP